MKKKTLYSCLMAASVFVTSCTKDFQQINTDPNKTTAEVFNPNFLLAQAQINYSQTGYDQLLFQSMWSQSLASTYNYYSNGDKYVASGSFNDYKGRVYNSGYNASTLVDEMRILTNGKAQYTNLNAIGLIMRVLILQRVTDAYGDVPYSEAGRAKEGIFTPKFDTQQAIYTAMLNDLDLATKALNAAGDKPSSDLMYGGDIAKWKKFGFSLMLRVAMRLTKADAATAQKYALIAYAGGTMTSIDDNAKVKADVNGNSNSTTNALTVADDYREVRWSAPLIAFMKSSVDPRVSAVAEVSNGTGLAANSKQVAGDNTFAKQIGMPNGYDLNGGTTDISKAPNYPGTSAADPSVSGDAPAPDGKYSRPRTTVYLQQSGINMLLTYGETELLLAEAASRGWAVGTAATHYANALKADLMSLSQFSTDATIDDATATAYAAAHPLVATTALEQINMEYWVETSTMMQFNETWANWRRSGFPVLTPVTYTGQFSTGIPRRVAYPVNVASTNPTNLAEAIGRLSGGDTFTSRMYWDK